MKPLALRTIIFFSPHRSSSSSFLSLQISHFSFSSHSPYTSSCSSSFAPRRHEESKNEVRVSVWWDFKKCSLPSGDNVFRVGDRITEAVRANGIEGPIQITAFGDILQLSRRNQEVLASTGIRLAHIPHSRKNNAGFATILHRLRMQNYNILLATRGNAPRVLSSAASIMWHWHALMRGENITGKHFNQPPDGPYGSLYGHCNVPLEDAFSRNEQSDCFTSGDSSGKKSDGIPEECFTSSVSSGKTKSEEERVKSISQTALPVGLASLSLFSNDSALEDRTARSSEVCGDKCSATPGYFSQIINWCKFWSAGPNSDTSRDQSSERPNQINGHPETHEIFSTDSFWSEMESFIDTPKGSVLVSQSKTRLQMAQNLQKQVPLILVSLKESDLLHLVDLLISEKKWVEECPSQTLPFKVTRAIGKCLSFQ